jgi:hypothetical protein
MWIARDEIFLTFFAREKVAEKINLNGKGISDADNTGLQK